jgi:ferric-dicitrate binding protein FerR (iron transport regulator)
MSAPRYARRAATLLARAAERELPPPRPESRESAIHALGIAIRRRSRNRLRLRYAAAVVAVASVAAATVLVAGLRPRRTPLAVSPGQTPSSEAANGSGKRASDAVVVVAHPMGAGASVVASGGPTQLGDGVTLGEGSHVVAAAEGRAVLSFSTGTKLTLEEGGDLTIVDEAAMELFTLSGGSLRADVAKLSAGQRFVVRTGDAEIEVRGTSFRVGVAPRDAQCATTTRLTVFEGVVVVRAAEGETRVAAGESWPRGCGSADPAASPRLVARGPSPTVDRERHPVVDPASTLAAQNDAYQRALAAKRRGATDEALAGFDRLLSLYPAGPLAESATVEKMRLLSSRDRASASAVAKRYLAAYPAGFARAEAEAISGSP